MVDWWHYARNIKLSAKDYLYTALVDGHPGDEPRCLENEDGGDGDGARNAKRLQSGQDLQGDGWYELVL